MITEELKSFIKTACGTECVGIASVHDMTDKELKDIAAVNRILAAYTPLYSSDTPVLQPSEFLDDAKCCIVMAININFGEKELPGNPPCSEVMNFYVNHDCLNYFTERAEKVVGFLEEKGYSGFSLNAGISQKLISARSAIARYGKNAVIQFDGMGSQAGIMLIITDAPLEIDEPGTGDCGDCTLCRDACPTGALNEPYACDIEKCLTMHMIYNKGDLPKDIREKAGTVIAHCNICVDICPKNRNLPVQTDISVPKDLVYPEIAPLVNISDEKYAEMFDGTFLEFTFLDKKYLQRNAAVALGNYGDPEYVPILKKALETQTEEIVRGHAAWALGRIGGQEAKKVLEGSLQDESSPGVISEIKEALSDI